MKKISMLLFGLTAPFFLAQQAGDLVNVEQKLDLTPQGVANFIANSLGEQNAPDFVSYLNGFNVGLKGYKITYYTKNEKNVLVKATGLLMYPNVNFKLSTVVSDHGTTDSRDNVPSNFKGALTAGFVVELSYVLNGYILMAPDYVGMGTGDGVHPYVDYATEAGATIDFVTAANKVLAQQGIKRYDEYFLAGYSQGAHAAMSTLKMLNVSNPANLKFKYAYMGDGPYDFSGVTLNKGVLEKDFYPFTSFLANVLHTCNNTGYKTYNTSISEVISPEYLDKYNYHVVQDNGGLLWGPVIWQNLFTQSFVNDVTNNPNNNLRRCMKPKDVYDWYNKTPMTLGHSTVDLAIPPENTSKTIDVQRGYYAWWDLNKYKLDSFYWGPLGHVGGIVPFTLASNAKFNTLRSGGLLNQWAILSSKQQENKPAETVSLYSSQLKPDLGNMQLVEITDFNQEKTANKSGIESSLSTLKDGVYLLKVQENNNQKLIPYVKNTPIEVPENEIIQSENNGILKLKLPQEELIAVNIFDANKNLLKTVSQEQYAAHGGIETKDIDNQNNTFEIVTQYYNLQFKKSQDDRSLANKNEIFTKNRQVVARADHGIKNISIYSISGALILQQEVNQPEFESNSLESGIYIVQMMDTDGKTVNKKVKL
ncbi:T9SS C-terminal target domain-containing protein [Chryseobacterium carnipullorum]|uniref:Por secretion system C-terminal sorting domain n=1 Tax=Chryseobacterium carnipullorum TaxID=1124835 RepID=A0A376E118_CHRCU|nr:T9SS type A sorting domain-containing protein [Chryseobacterium carnipullorum]AZA50468.1 T9SS C-terminal target domain-containing protein [Chryseobacterium carnipullorum]AZA65336.1 T9SS C-terminal target domain-containing protein [Chryseobacterium carnipullorum]STC99746.1 Por secretion system C-terminal sorting domain [Chryseobacterium carnipullorum]